MMGHRAKRHDADWLPKLLMGLGIAAGVLSMYQGGRRRERRHRDRPPSSILFALLGVFFAFVVAMVLLSGLLSLIGGAGGLGMLCFAPAAIIGFVVWVVTQAQKNQGSQGQNSEPWTRRAAPYEYDGGRLYRESQSATTAAPPPPVQKPAAAPAPLPPRRQATVPPAVQPAVRTATPRSAPQPATINPYPEKGAVKPAEYRQRAASYRRRIQGLIKTRRPGPLAARLNEMLKSLKSWEERVGQLADRLDIYETDDLIRRDIREVPTKIAKLARLVELEVDPEMRRQMTRTLSAYQEQQRQLDNLARVMRRTRLNLDDTLANMGTIYSQVQVLNAMDVDGTTAERIAGEINTEVDRLNDLLSAVSEVNQHATAGTTTLPSAASAPAASAPAPSAATDQPEDENGDYAARRARLEGKGGAG